MTKQFVRSLTLILAVVLPTFIPMFTQKCPLEKLSLTCFIQCRPLHLEQSPASVKGLCNIWVWTITSYQRRVEFQRFDASKKDELHIYHGRKANYVISHYDSKSGDPYISNYQHLCSLEILSWKVKWWGLSIFSLQGDLAVCNSRFPLIFLLEIECGLLEWRARSPDAVKF